MTADRLTHEQRKGIGDLAKKSPNVSALARFYHVDRGNIRRWLEEGLKTTQNWVDAPRSGRPSKLSKVQTHALRRHAKHRNTAEQIANRMWRRHEFQISPRTIRRVLGRGRKPLFWLPINYMSKLNPQTIPLRQQFAEAHVDDDFSSTVFLDAKDFFLYYEADGRATFCWQLLDDPTPPGAPSNPYVFRLYGAVGKDFKSPLFFVPPSPPEGSALHKSKETYKSEHYIRMMQQLKVVLDKRYPLGGYRIIRDRAKQHTSKASTSAMASMGMPIMLDYPAQSWDMNIIENVWGVLDGNLHGATARSTGGWYSHIRAAWAKIHQGTINTLVDGMHNRLSAVMEAEGQWIFHH